MSVGKPVSSTKVAQVLIVDDHPAVREGLALAISQHADLQVCGEAASIAEALDMIGLAQPDIAIVDISLKDGSGIDLIKRLQARDESIRILVCSMHEETHYAERAIRAGAMGYISKEHATHKIIDALRRILNNKLYVSEQVAELLMRRTLGSGKAAVRSSVDLLSDRELEVFDLLGQGQDTIQIAERMHVSPKTIETYRVRIKDKLGIQTIPELLRRAVEWNLDKT